MQREKVSDIIRVRVHTDKAGGILIHKAVVVRLGMKFQQLCNVFRVCSWSGKSELDSEEMSRRVGLTSKDFQLFTFNHLPQKSSKSHPSSVYLI